MRLFNSKRAQKATRVSQTANIKTSNASIVGSSGIGGACDFGANTQPSVEPQVLNPFVLLREVDLLYHTDWQAQKIIDIPVDYMLKKQYQFKGITDEQSKDLDIYQEDLGVHTALRQALRMERLYGGAVIFMGIKDEVDDPAEPVNLDKITPGDLIFMNALSRESVSAFTMQTDPTLPNYGKPEWYTIYGKRVHVSRLLIFDGDPITYLNKYAYLYSAYNFNDRFGYPILGRLLQDLKRATGVRQAAAHLIDRASVMVFKGDIQSGAALKDSNQNLSSLRSLVNSISNYRAALINSDPGTTADLSTISANFGAIPELIITYLQVLSASEGIPASIFLSQAPGGLNANSESERSNFFDKIAAQQVHRLSPQLRKFLNVLAPSAGVSTPVKDIEIFFPPIHSASDEEEATVRQIDTQNVVSLVADGLISTEEALEELKQRDVLLTDPSEFPDPDPTGLNLDNDDLNETSDFNKSLKKLRGEPSDDDLTAK